jgi:hypothetical protein
MKLLARVPDAVMIAAFLKAEVGAARYGEQLLRLLGRDRRDRAILDAPDVGDDDANRYRAWLLGEVRGYERNEDVFTDMPNDVVWYQAILEPSDLDALMYIDYDYWTDFTGGSRRVRDAAQRISEGAFPWEEVGHFHALAEVVRRGTRFPEVILLHNPKSGELVVLEGHKRITAYLMLPDPRPPELLHVIVGRSDRIKK